MKYLLALLLITSCSLFQRTEIDSPEAPSKPAPTRPTGPKIGSCFISSVSDSIYKVLRCNNYHCLVKSEYETVGETTMTRQFVKEQLTVACPEELK
jgi:hypothetical protein